MTPGRPTTGIRRDEIVLGGWGCTRDDQIWIVPNDAPVMLITMVEDVCDRRGHDWVYVKDRM